MVSAHLALIAALSLFGVLGNIAAQFLGSGRVISHPGVPINPGALADTAQAAAWWSLLVLVLSAIAGALGGWRRAAILSGGCSTRPRLLGQGRARCRGLATALRHRPSDGAWVFLRAPADAGARLSLPSPLSSLSRLQQQIC
jgi:hypothetical protein